jgi:hypothetical protein
VKRAAGVSGGDRSGAFVSDAGDVNGDGVGDLLVAAHRADPNGKADAGETYVVFGRTTGFPAAFELRRLYPALGGNGSEGLIIKGIDADDRSGISVRGGMDVSGDGVDDLIIGANGGDPGGRSEAGESYVVFGRPSLAQ